jgi:hypothetical protein
MLRTGSLLARTQSWLWACAASPVIFVLLLAGLFLGPLWSLPGIPNTADGILHLHRAAAMARSWQEGVLWPRWFPDAYQGLGVPVFHYYSPLFYLLVTPLHLAGLRLDLSTKLVITAMFVFSGLATSAWLRRLLTPAAGLAGAMLYLSGAHLFREYYFQGDYPQLIALFWLPVVFWALTSLYDEGRRRDWLLAPLSLALLVIAHNITAMLGAVLLVVYWLALPFCRRSWAGWWRGIAAGILGLGLSAFFWVPALGDASFVRLETLRQGFFTYSQYFVTLSDLLAGPPILDSRALNPPFPYLLGWAAWLAVACGAVAVLWPLLRRSRVTAVQRWAAVGVVLVLVLLALTLAQAAPLWSKLPGLALIQFPGRLLGPATMAVALAGGSAIAVLGERRAQLALPILLLAVTLVSTPFLFVRHSFVLVDNYTVADTQAWERATHAWGTTSSNGYMPRWADPPRAYAGQEAETSYLPPGAEWTWTSPHRAILRAANGSELPAGTVTLPTHYFPAWRASADGADVPIAVGPGGLLSVQLPQAALQITLQWRGTPWEHRGEWLSAGALILWLLTVASRGLGAKRAIPRPANTHTPAMSSTGEGRGPAVKTYWGLNALLLALIVVRGTIMVSGQDRVWRATLASTLGRPAHPMSVILGGGEQPAVTLLGWDMLSTQSPVPGQSLRVRLYWQAEKPIPEALHSFVHLFTSSPPHSWAVVQNENPGRIPTTVWPPGFYVVDDLTLTLPYDLPPTSLMLVAGLVQEDGERLAVPGNADRLVLLDTITVRPLAAGRWQPVHAAVAAPGLFGSNLWLQGYDLLPDPAGPILRLYWEVRPLPPQTTVPALTTFVHLLNEDGQIVAQFDGPPLDGVLPTSHWPTGALLIDRRPLRLPGGLKPGNYTLLVGFYEPTTMQRVVVRPQAGAEDHYTPENALKIGLYLPAPTSAP